MRRVLVPSERECSLKNSPAPNHRPPPLAACSSAPLPDRGCTQNVAQNSQLNSRIVGIRIKRTQDPVVKSRLHAKRIIVFGVFFASTVGLSYRVAGTVSGTTLLRLLPLPPVISSHFVALLYQSSSCHQHSKPRDHAHTLNLWETGCLTKVACTQT